MGAGSMMSNAKSNIPSKKSKAINVLLWGVQVLAAITFVMAGSSKLLGNEMTVQMFSTIGLGQWFRYLTGTIEILGAILLLVPPLCGVGAILLAMTMVGAVLTHLFIVGGSPAMPLGLLALMVCVAFGRRDQILRLI
jgi:uncharacterized membrane protein YphA (DoxX/SURF4 family)